MSSARDAVEQLLEIGRSRIALVGAPAISEDAASSASLRERVYREALAAAGIRFDPDLVARGGSWGRDTGSAAIRDLCRRGVGFDAVFALNDSLALGALRRLALGFLRVLDDVAVIGFDTSIRASFGTDQMKFSATGSPDGVEAGQLTLRDIREALASITERRAEEPNLFYLDRTAPYGERFAEYAVSRGAGGTQIRSGERVAQF